MEVMDRIKRCKNDEQLYWLTKKLIKEALNEEKGLNKYRGLIGTKSEINRKECDFDPNNNSRISFSVPFWNGYVPLNTKIVYGIACDKDIVFDSNCGFYYYVDDDSYVYDFIKYIKDLDIEDPLDAISIINEFTRKLFEKSVDPQSRLLMHRLLIKGDYEFYEPTQEHSIKDFYGNGSAQCTEYALVACNLLNVLGISTYYCMDKDHAFNIFFIDDEENKKSYDGYLLDYSNCINVYDIHSNYIGRFPFYVKIDASEKTYIYLDEENCIEVDTKSPDELIKEEDVFYNDLINHGKRIETSDIFAIVINNQMFKAIKDNKRNYGIECGNTEGKKELVKRKEKSRLVL